MRSPHRRIHPLTWFFGAWFAATVAAQKLWRTEGRPSQWDRFYLVVPDWRFFAPDPGVYDYHVLVRTVSTEGAVGPWKEITQTAERRPCQALWHPEHREEKVLFDVCTELFRFVERHRVQGTDSQEMVQRIQLSVAYLTLLHYTSGRVLDTEAMEVQFMIALSGGYDAEDPEIVFVSERHTLDKGTCGPGSPVH